MNLSSADAAFVRSLILHEDDHILAFAKPAGLTSQGGRIAAHTLDDLLGAFAKSNGKRPRLVHRLDRDTSGVILAAKTQPAAAFLGKAMMARRVVKTYLALVAPGAPKPRAGVIDIALRRVEVGRQAHVETCAGGESEAQTASTAYRTLAASAGAALVELLPKTGRMHQLRVHLASIGRPILGDARYGGALAVNGIVVPRLMLHAVSLRFPHPGGGTLSLETPPPRDFASLRDQVTS